MKTDKILQLIQQKKVMRSGGALPLPKHQSRGQVAPLYVTDKNDPGFKAYNDSLSLYNAGEKLKLKSANLARNITNEYNQNRHFWNPSAIFSSTTHPYLHSGFSTDLQNRDDYSQSLINQYNNYINSNLNSFFNNYPNIKPTHSYVHSTNTDVRDKIGGYFTAITPGFKKPVQDVIFRSSQSLAPILQPKSTRPTELELMPMRGTPLVNINIPEPEVKGRPTYRNWNTGEVMYDIPAHLKLDPNWRTPEKKEDGGLAKAQKGLPKQNPYLPNTPLATGAAESVPGLETLLFPAELPLAASTALGRGAITLAEILNPLGGLRPSTDMMYRGLGREGFEDAMKSGVLRPKQDVPPIVMIGKEGKGRFDLAKRFENTFYSPYADIAMDYGNNYVAAVPRSAADFVMRYHGKAPKHWSQFTSRQIPVNEATFYQKYPVVGYKKKLGVKAAGGLTADKAKEILHDKSVHGKPLTDKQRRFFGAIASGNKVRVRLPK